MNSIWLGLFSMRHINLGTTKDILLVFKIWEQKQIIALKNISKLDEN